MRHNILYLDAYYGLGGGQKSLLALLKGLDKNRYNPIVMVPSYIPLEEEVNKLGVEVIKLPMSSYLIQVGTEGLKKSFWHYLLSVAALSRALWEIYRICVKKRIDIIHANSIKTTIIAGIPARLLKIPLIWHVRHGAFHGKIFEFLSAMFSTKLIGVSKFVCKEVSQWVGKFRNKIILIYNGIDFHKPIGKFCDLKKELKLEEDYLAVGIVGRLVPWKGHKILLYAAKEVLEEIPNTYFLIVGEIPSQLNEKYKFELLNLVKELKIQDNVIFCGWRNSISAIASLDVFVLPSQNEPLGRVILEAQSLRKPVIATNSGGNPEIIEHRKTGILVPENNVKLLASAILELLKNPELGAKLALAGEEVAEKNFNLKTYVKNIEHLYTELLY